MKKPSISEIEDLLKSLLKGAPLEPFDNGYVCALEWILGKRECLYDQGIDSTVYMRGD